MKIIAIEKEIPGTLPEHYQPHLKHEAQLIFELQQKEFIREIYFRKDEASAVLILECDSVETAEQTLYELPLVKNKLITFDLIPLKPYPGYKRLFQDTIQT